MALIDINTVTNIYDFTKACNEVGIKPLVDIEFRCNHQLRYIGLAKNADGLTEMNRLLTRHNFEYTSLPSAAPPFNNVCIIYPFENKPAELKGHEFIGIAPNSLQNYFFWNAMLYLKKWWFGNTSRS